MRHEGIPTRLLDWTENIGTALFFALSSNTVENPHIWVLNPYKLNDRDSKAGGTLLNPDEDLGQYSETYASYCNDKTVEINTLPIAIYPNRTNDRIFAQRGLFTIHGTDEQKMELTSHDSIERIDIPSNLIDRIKLLIKHFGINTYSVYPDFKGLSDYLKRFTSINFRQQYVQIIRGLALPMQTGFRTPRYYWLPPYQQLSIPNKHQ
ncbi:MAG: FRG domain-containing protein [Cyclobacteriaceae bacterium]|nr:FRG domain-containing protein [Cyclobacteriaceae bacterium]